MSGPGDRDAVAADIRRAMEPATHRTIEGWLAELSVISAKRVDDEFAEELRAEAYASRLGQYPADVAREVILRRPWKFWPTWAEMEKECERLTAPRRNMLAALEMRQRETYSEEIEEQPTGEARRFNAREILKHYGYRVPE